MDFHEVAVPNTCGFEVLVGAGSVPGQRRKIVVISCYLPPNYHKKRGEDGLTFSTDTVISMKKKYHDPQIAIAGDFNQ